MDTHNKDMSENFPPSLVNTIQFSGGRCLERELTGEGRQNSVQQSLIQEIMREDHMKMYDEVFFYGYCTQSDMEITFFLLISH